MPPIPRVKVRRSTKLRENSPLDASIIQQHRWLLAGLHVVAPEHAMVPDVKPAVSDHGIGPRLLHLVGVLRLVRRRETTSFTIGVRSRFNQRHVTVLAVEIKTTVGVTKRRRAQRAVFPLYPARGELRAKQRLSGRAIKEIPDLYRPTDCRRQFRFEVHLLRLNTFTFDIEFDNT